MITTKGIRIQFEQLRLLDDINEKEAGCLFKAIAAYALGRDDAVAEYTRDRAVGIVFTQFKKTIDADAEAYAEICRKNKENASRRKRPLATVSDRQRPLATVSDRSPILIDDIISDNILSDNNNSNTVNKPLTDNNNSNTVNKSINNNPIDINNISQEDGVLPRAREAKPSPAKKQEAAKLQYAEEVRMTLEEYRKLLARFGQEQTDWMVEKLNNHKMANGTKYKSDYRAILNWVVDAYEKRRGGYKPANNGGGTGNGKMDTYKDFFNDGF